MVVGNELDIWSGWVGWPLMSASHQIPGRLSSRLPGGMGLGRRRGHRWPMRWLGMIMTIKHDHRIIVGFSIILQFRLLV